MFVIIFEKHVSNHVSNAKTLIMKQRNITVTIVPDKRKIKDDVTFPLKLRITYQGKRKYYATGCHGSLNDYSLINRKHIHNHFMCTLTITAFGFLLVYLR